MSEGCSFVKYHYQNFNIIVPLLYFSFVSRVYKDSVAALNDEIVVTH